MAVVNGTHLCLLWTHNTACTFYTGMMLTFPGLSPEVVESALRIPALEFYGQAIANFRGGSYGRGLQIWRRWKDAVGEALGRSE